MAVTFNNGIVVPTQTEIEDNLKASLRAIYGENLRFDPNTPDGQRIAIFANMISSNYQGLDATYNAFDPNTAAGFDLDRISRLTGLERRVGETDAELRLRRLTTLYRNSQFTSASLRKAFENLDWVYDVRVYDAEDNSSLTISPGEVVIFISYDGNDSVTRDPIIGRILALLKPAGILSAAAKDRGATSSVEQKSWRGGVETGSGSYEVFASWNRSINSALNVAITVGRDDSTISLPDDFQDVLNAGNFLDPRNIRIGQPYLRGDMERYVSSLLPQGFKLHDLTLQGSTRQCYVPSPGVVATHINLAPITYEAA